MSAPPDDAETWNLGGPLAGERGRPRKCEDTDRGQVGGG